MFFGCLLRFRIAAAFIGCIGRFCRIALVCYPKNSQICEFVEWADLIEERPQFPQRPTDVATGAPRSGHQAKAESVRFGGLSGLMLSGTEASRCLKAEPSHGKGGSDHAREHTRAHMEGRTHSNA